MTTDLPALDTYDAEIVTLTGYYSLRIAEAEEAAANARQALTTAEATLAELTSERAAAVRQARERLLTATGAEIRDGGIRGKPGRPTRRGEPPAPISPTPDPILANLVADAERMLAAPTLDLADPTVTVAMMSLAPPAGEAPTAAEGAPREVAKRGALGVTPERLIAAVTGHTSDGEIADASAADAFTADVSEPEKRLLENGFSREEIAAMPVAERWTLHRSNTQRKDVAKYPDGWREPMAGEDLPF